MTKIAALAAIFLSFATVASAQPHRELDRDAIERVLQSKGTVIPAERVLKFTFPRVDVPITVDGAKLPPFMGLTTWFAFQPGHRKPAVLAADVVLFQDEVNSAMSAALDSGLNVTALHNHFFFDSPKVFFMHLEAEGEDAALASAAKHILDSIKSIRAKSPAPADHFDHPPLPDHSTISAAPLDAIFAAKGQSKDGMYKIAFGQIVEMPCGCQLGKEMGINTWAAFYGSDDYALVDGDFACPAFQLQDVLKSLRQSNINIVAIHNHMETEAPRMMFLHYFATGKPSDLATAVKTALATIKPVNPQASDTTQP